MGNRAYNPYLSKSLFLRGLQCNKSLYLHKYHPELRDDVTESMGVFIQSGISAGVLAQGLFPDGVNIPYEGLSLEEQINLTKAEIDNGATTLYEAAFSHNRLFTKTDIINKGSNGWEIYEIKGTTRIKELYLEDIAFQYHVLKSLGIPVNRASLVHINNRYERQGDIDLHGLFTVHDLTNDVLEMQEYISDEVKKLRKMLNGETPEIDIGEYCEKSGCDFHGHCWRHLPEDSVFNLYGRGIDKYDLYRKGIIQLKDIPLDILDNHQRIQAEAFLEKKDFTNRDGVRAFLDSLWYPMYFLDFETFLTAIPPLNGTKPYQQIPFQYSLHYLENEGAGLGHHEFIAEPKADPREDLLMRLLSEIPDNACVITYTNFEVKILRNLSGWFPKYNEQIEKIISNIRDLAEPFKQKDYYHWQMQGSYSIKAVLPVLAPELSYKGMEISDGSMAMEAYDKICRSEDPAEVEQIRKALLEYCKLDTLAMVRIVEKLRRL